jgi:hypothetical protein
LSEETLSTSGVLKDADPSVRLAAILSMAELPASESAGTMLYGLSTDKTISEDDWLAKATYIAATKHQKGFTNAFLNTHPGYERPQEVIQKRETANWDDTNWKTMQLPQPIEQAGLEIDGLVWFRTNFTVPQKMAGKSGMISLGRIDESDETWLNGEKIGATEKMYLKDRMYPVPGGRLKAGKNSIAVRVEDKGGRGGFWGKAEDMFLQIGEDKIKLDGGWKYEVEKEYSATRQNIFKLTRCVS